MYAPLTRRARVVVIVDDKILVVRNKLGPNVWQLPGGGIKFGESVADAATREVFEELKVASKSALVMNQEPLVCSQFGLLFRLHFVRITPQEPMDIVMQSSEIAEYEWLPVAELANVAKEVTMGLDLVEAKR
jgi:8-oxo-dGTP pyrophosphatase MutT (NUDIX family)